MILLALVLGGEAREATRWVYVEETLPRSLSPLEAETEAEWRAVELVFDRLVRDSAVHGPGHSRILASWTQQESTLVVEIAAGRRWHDGTEVSAQDICSSVDAWIATSPVQRAKLKGCDAVSNTTAHVELTRPGVDNPLDFYLLPSHALDNDDFGQRPVGTGPMLGQLGRREAKFKAYRKVNPDGPQALELLEGGDPFVQVKWLEKGSVHGFPIVPPALEVAVPDHVALVSRDDRAWWYVALNQAKLPDPRIRTALEHALDVTDLQAELMGSDAQRMTGPFLPGSSLHNAGITPLEADPDELSRLMIEAGASLGSSRTWTIDGEELKLYVGLDARLQTTSRNVLHEVSGRLQRAGFAVEMWRIAADDWDSAVTGGYNDKLHLLIGRWRSAPDEDPRALLHSEGKANAFGYSRHEVDRLVEQMQAAESPFERRTAAWELQGMLAADRPYLFLWTEPQWSAWDRRLQPVIEPVHYFTDIEHWRVRP